MTHEEKNKQIVRRFIEKGLVDAATNPDALHEYVADHYVDHSNIFETNDIHGLKAGAKDSHAASPDLLFEVVHQAASGDIVFTHWKAKWTHGKAQQKHRKLKTVAPHGAEVQAGGVFIFRLESDKIVESWTYENTQERAMAAGKAA
jgi:predicted SnoaL-like aldol condensation-catalyzing enzyme